MSTKRAQQYYFLLKTQCNGCKHRRESNDDTGLWGDQRGRFIRERKILIRVVFTVCMTQQYDEVICHEQEGYEKEVKIYLEVFAYTFEIL